MNNAFKFYGILWTSILILYLLNWSNLSMNLSPYVLTFILILIVASFVLGKIFSKYFRSLEINKYTVLKKHSQIIRKGKFILIYFILTFLIAKKIPLLEAVLYGQTIENLNIKSIPGITVFMTAYVIYSSFEFSYMFAFYKDREALKYNLIIFAYFILMLSRQYVLVCLAIFLYSCYIAKYVNHKHKIKFCHKISWLILLLLITALVLYGFGAMGNIRYGNKWRWNDSSMIFTLGEGNVKWPHFLPKEYFWSYIYLVSPLANFNANVVNFLPNNHWNEFLVEFIPDVISNKFNAIHAPVYLPVSSLTVSTSFEGSYRTMGILGCYLMLFIIFLISIVIILLTYNRRKEQMFPQICGILYIMIMSIFTNPFVFSVTGMLILLMIVESFKPKIQILKL